MFHDVFKIIADVGAFYKTTAGKTAERLFSLFQCIPPLGYAWQALISHLDRHCVRQLPGDPGLQCTAAVPAEPAPGSIHSAACTAVTGRSHFRLLCAALETEIRTGAHLPAAFPADPGFLRLRCGHPHPYRAADCRPAIRRFRLPVMRRSCRSVKAKPCSPRIRDPSVMNRGCSG